MPRGRRRRTHPYPPGIHSAPYHGEKCGTLGTISCFSFFSKKNLVTGEGGMVFTRNQALAEKVRAMRSHGMKALSWDKYRGHLSTYDIGDLGYNYRTTEIQSALGLVQLKKLDRNNQKRRRVVKAYRRELQGAEGVSLPFPGYGTGPSYHLFPVLISPSIRSDDVMDALRGHGSQTSIHYPPIHLFSLYRKEFGYKKGMLPKTEEVSRRELTLPLHPLIGCEDVKWIAEKVKRVIQESSEPKP